MSIINISFILFKTKSYIISCYDPLVGCIAGKNSMQWPTGGSYRTECIKKYRPMSLVNHKENFSAVLNERLNKWTERARVLDEDNNGYWWIEKKRKMCLSYITFRLWRVYTVPSQVLRLFSSWGIALNSGIEKLGLLKIL